MEIENYFRKLEKLAVDLEEKQVATHEYLENMINEGDDEIKELISFRKEFIDSNERDKVLGYLTIGFFNQYSGSERVACFLMTFEIDEIKTKNNWKKRCEIYCKKQPIFQFEPKLFERIRTKENGKKDLELIDFTAFDQINDSEIIKTNESYTLIDFALNPLIVAWAKENFRENPLYVRANPFKAFKEKPMQRLFESILMPANPNWWRNLSIHKNTKEGASYLLDDCSPKEDERQFWEFHIKNISKSRSYC